MAPNLFEGHRVDADIVLQESEREAVAELLGGCSHAGPSMVVLTASRLPRECNRPTSRPSSYNLTPLAGGYRLLQRTSVGSFEHTSVLGEYRSAA
jgi:hypothetical protein